MLHDFVEMNRDEIIRRCRSRVAARSFPNPPLTERDHGVPLFLDQLMDALRSGAASNPSIGRSAIQHGRDLLLRGCSISHVVHTYGDVCQAVTQLAVEMDSPIRAADFRTLNHCLNEAIAGAVTGYGREREQATTVVANARDEQVGFVVHELRNLVNTAIGAFEVLRTGNVGAADSTGSVLYRSLLGLRTLVGRSVAELRLGQATQHRERIVVSVLIDELAAAAALEAHARRVLLTVLPVEAGLEVEGDPQVLTAVLGNLLQNAFKFTRPATSVTLRVRASAERVLVEVEDECGGLPDGTAEHVFQPLQQQNTDRTGLGLGLAFSRWGIEANHGRIYARSLPSQGCIFTVDLPRLVRPVHDEQADACGIDPSTLLHAVGAQIAE